MRVEEIKEKDSRLFGCMSVRYVIRPSVYWLPEPPGQVFDQATAPAIAYLRLLLTSSEQEASKVLLESYFLIVKLVVRIPETESRT